MAFLKTGVPRSIEIKVKPDMTSTQEKKTDVGLAPM